MEVKGNLILGSSPIGVRGIQIGLRSGHTRSGWTRCTQVNQVYPDLGYPWLSTTDRSYRYRQYHQLLGYETRFIVWRRLQEKNYRFCRQCYTATRATRALNAQNYRQYRFYRSCRLRRSWQFYCYRYRSYRPVWTRLNGTFGIRWRYKLIRIYRPILLFIFLPPKKQKAILVLLYCDNINA